MDSETRELDMTEEYMAGKQGITAQELLSSIDAAIVAITVGGQSYKIGSRSLTRADLKELSAIRKELQAQIASEQSTGLLDDCYVAVFDGR